MEDLPLIVTPHPLNDLTPEEVRGLARSAYPIVIRQLTGQGPLEKQTNVDFVHPVERGRAARDAHDARPGKEPS